MTATVRAETVGSLLRPAELRAARERQRAGEASEEAVRAAEDEAVLAAITLQEDAGLDVITDGELRRTSWIATVRGTLSGFQLFPGGPGWQWRGTERAAEWTNRPFPYVSGRIEPLRDLAETEYAFLRAHARARTKYCLPAPSYHRTVWHPEHSRAAYPRCEDFLIEIRDYLRSVVRSLVALGCDYVQLDAPNYGNLCDPELRAIMAAQGRDLDAELPFDAELDNSVFDGVTSITRAMHICRGNAAGNWAASGGYDRIAPQLFPRLRLDRLLLEYDSPRAGDFGALRHVRPETTAVLGLVTTKTGELEEHAAVEARIREASMVKPCEQLALSPQCGFASVEAGNPVSPEEQTAKLHLVSDVARRVWG
jgi:5-methyltetrahydropteroyltriglutamate--homocysteine methyltransferase